MNDKDARLPATRQDIYRIEILLEQMLVEMRNANEWLMKFATRKS